MAKTKTKTKNLFFVIGDAALDKRLAAMPLSLQKKGARKATRRVAKAVLEDARKLAPVKSGALKKSLTVRAGKRNRAKQYKNDVKTVVITRDGMFQGKQFYAGLLEFGTTNRQDKQGRFRGKVGREAFLYLRPALYRNKHARLQIFKDELTNWLTIV